jgi:hypothetical protein
MSDFFCKICNQSFVGMRQLSMHISRIHNVEKKKYYDTYLKNENEGLCLSCGNLKFIFKNKRK